MEPKHDLELLQQLYDQQPYTVDMICHTAEEEDLVNRYNSERGTSFSRREVYVTLMTMRKRGRLHPKGRKKNAPSLG